MAVSLSQFLWSSDFIPHGMCLSWQPEVVGLMAVSETIIGASYLMVAVALGVFARRRSDFPYPGIITLISMVFALCGLSHILDVVVLWLPWYGIQALFNAGVAILAVPAAW